MIDPRMKIDPATQYQEDQALIMFLRQRCAFLAQAFSLERQASGALQEELEQLKKEIQELKENVMTGGQNG